MAHWPHERSLVKKMKGKPFALLGVNVFQKDPAAMKAMMEKHDLPWRSFTNHGEIVKTWNAPQTPSFYVIDPAGVIRHKWIGHPGEDTIDLALDSLLKETEKQ